MSFVIKIEFSQTEEAKSKFEERKRELDAHNDLRKDVGFKHSGERLHVFFGHGIDDSKVLFR